MAKSKTLHVDAGGRSVRVDLSYDLDDAGARRVLSAVTAPHDTSDRAAVFAAIEEWASQAADPEPAPTELEPQFDPAPTPAARSRRSTAVV